VLLEEWLKELKATLSASLAVQATENILKDSWLKGIDMSVYKLSTLCYTSDYECKHCMYLTNAHQTI
jgi:hypothetical protein